MLTMFLGALFSNTSPLSGSARWTHSCWRVQSRQMSLHLLLAVSYTHVKDKKNVHLVQVYWQQTIFWTSFLSLFFKLMFLNQVETVLQRVDVEGPQVRVGISTDSDGGHTWPSKASLCGAHPYPGQQGRTHFWGRSKPHTKLRASPFFYHLIYVCLLFSKLCRYFHFWLWNPP